MMVGRISVVMPASRFFCLISSFFVLSLVDPCAQADSVSDFYRGKTITIQVGYGPGGEDYHAIDERAQVKELVASAKIYAELLTTFAG
jgi:acetylornithine deacetylase/succinyl-diaminopimelate desuccinylase-like protein